MNGLAFILLIICTTCMCQDDTKFPPEIENISSCGQNEYYRTCVQCVEVCKNLTSCKTSPPIACKPGCACIPGYAKDTLDKCIPKEECAYEGKSCKPLSSESYDFKCYKYDREIPCSETIPAGARIKINCKPGFRAVDGKDAFTNCDNGIVLGYYFKKRSCHPGTFYCNAKNKNARYCQGCNIISDDLKPDERLDCAVDCYCKPYTAEPVPQNSCPTNLSNTRYLIDTEISYGITHQTLSGNIPSGKSVLVKCKDGYTTAVSLKQSITCNEGTWSSEIPECVFADPRLCDNKENEEYKICDGCDRHCSLKQKCPDDCRPGCYCKNNYRRLFALENGKCIHKDRCLRPDK